MPPIPKGAKTDAVQLNGMLSKDVLGKLSKEQLGAIYGKPLGSVMPLDQLGLHLRDGRVEFVGKYFGDV